MKDNGEEGRVLFIDYIDRKTSWDDHRGRILEKIE
jgi:hypothetical protein